MGLRMTLFQLNQDKLEEIIENPEEIFEINYSEDEDNFIEIDKSWDGLKFLFSKLKTRDKNELSKLISNEQEILLDVSDMYDINYLTQEQVRKITTELNSVTESEIKEVFDFKAMNEMDIYGNPFDENYISYFVEYFQKVKSFYQIATNKKKAVVTFIS